MISFIIPNRGGKNVKFICNKLHNMFGDDCEYVVITQDDDRPFARGQLFNIGYKFTTGEYLCFIDNDIFFQKYIDLISLYENGNYIALQPLDAIAQVTLTGGETYKITSTKAIGPSSKGGVTFISRKNFEKVNGMSNLYMGWGYEDNEFDSRAGKIVRCKNTVCHISHPKRNDSNKFNTSINRAYFVNRGERDYKSDGYEDTVYTVVSNEKDGYIRYVLVKDIRVNESFKYKHLYDKHFELDKTNLRYNNIITDALAKHITSKYILIGLPQHMNLGDTLIWEAEVQMLNSLKVPRLYSYFFGIENFKIDSDTTIVWSGGGYFSDIWQSSLKYIKKILSKYNNNKHVFLPNSVFFSKEESCAEINSVLKNCKKEVVVFSRENQSYEEAKKLVKITSMLLPDVVLGWDIERYMLDHKIQNNEGDGILYISRNDREKLSNIDISANKTSDWPTMVSKPKYLKDCDAHFWSLDIRWRLVNEAISFIAPYKTVYSDRMHGAILAWLLKKETVLIDNSYHKSKSLYNTWLKNEPSITMQ